MGTDNACLGRIIKVKESMNKSCFPGNLQRAKKKPVEADIKTLPDACIKEIKNELKKADFISIYLPFKASEIYCVEN